MQSPHISQHPSGAVFITNRGPEHERPAPIPWVSEEPAWPLGTLTSREFVVEVVRRRQEGLPLGLSPDDIERFIECSTEPSLRAGLKVEEVAYMDVALDDILKGVFVHPPSRRS